MLYNSLGTTLVDLQVPVDEICRLPESGKNVISSSVDLLIYTKAGVAPHYVKPEMLSQLEAACAAGGTSVYSTGVTPGFALDLWPVTIGRTLRRVDALHITEMVSLREYKSSTVEFMGFGLPPDAEVEMFKMFEESPDDPSSGALNTPYGAALNFVGDAFQAEIDKITYEHRDVRLAKERTEFRAGVFEAGTVVGIEFRLTAGSGAKRLSLSISSGGSMTKAGHPTIAPGSWRSKATPPSSHALNFATMTDAKGATSITVAGHCLNAIPEIIKAAGIINHFSMPIFTGRASSSLRPAIAR